MSQHSESLQEPHFSSQADVKRIRRADLTILRSVVVDGNEKNLGILKDFRKHPDIAAFLPENARISLAWVSLAPGETLQPHVHDTESMIVMAHGEGRIVGDLDDRMEEGDIVLIPRGRRHGFVGAGAHPFWALSIQFEGRGLYEDPKHGRVHFTGAEGGLQKLLALNESFAEGYRGNAMFQLVSSGELQRREMRARFFDCVQVWSSYFQRAIFARSAATDDRRFGVVFRKHLIEEFGHDLDLARERGGTRPVWDPVLDACGNWFCWKMLTCDNVEKIILIHLVLEVGGSVISAHAGPAINPLGETSYFAVHDEADALHQELGLELLQNVPEASFPRLFQVQAEGWDMLNLLSKRIAELSHED